MCFLPLSLLTVLKSTVLRNFKFSFGREGGPDTYERGDYEALAGWGTIVGQTQKCTKKLITVAKWLTSLISLQIRANQHTV